MREFFKDFAKFINRGNVIDLAVAVVIGTAFGAITKSLVNHIIMPPIGLLLGGVDFSDLGIIMRGAGQYGSVAEAIEAGAPVLQYGTFINTVINFFIVALAVFTTVRAYKNLRARFEEEEQEAPAKPAIPPREQVLLEEIRDLLAQQRSGPS
ncbi:MAG: large-conductance mechanosensitive channel protein MscL [Truepera sp.]|nr:large-conductance mechanosensitive channel protein MscL [Truepera sp.]